MDILLQVKQPGILFFSLLLEVTMGLSYMTLEHMGIIGVP